MKRLVRIFQLLNFRRTAKMEAQMQEMQRAMLNLLDASMRLAVSQNIAQEPAYEEFMATAAEINRILGIIDGMLISGRVDDARLILEDLISATKATGTHG